MKVNVIGKRKIWFSISGALVIASIISVAVFGLNFGIDFTGGSLMDVRFEQEVDVIEMRGALEEIGYDAVRVQSSDANRVIVRLPALTEQEHQDTLSTLEERFGAAEELRFDMIGPVIGYELRKKALYAIGFALILILIYIAWAFRKVSKPIASWKYGLLTIVAALHDLIIPIGIFAILGKLFGFQVDTAFVAALLTILGYSINDTIVVFDRTRENLINASSTDAFSGIVNKSVNQTFTRSINTSITTMLALAAVYFFGGDTTRQFALTLILGISVGAYSSIFLASPLLVFWEKIRQDK